MRELSVCEISYVGGGPSENPISDAVGNSCVGLPDSATITVTIGTPGLQIGPFAITPNTSIVAEVNCGEFNAANSSSSDSSSSSGSSSSGGYYTPYVMGSSGPYIVIPVAENAGL